MWHIPLKKSVRAIKRSWMRIMFYSQLRHKRIIFANVVKRNIKMSEMMTAITDQFSPIKSHRWAHIWQGEPANTLSLSILPNNHLGPCPILYCFIRLYCGGRDVDPFFKIYIYYCTYYSFLAFPFDFINYDITNSNYLNAFNLFQGA